MRHRLPAPPPRVAPRRGGAPCPGPPFSPGSLRSGVRTQSSGQWREDQVHNGGCGRGLPPSGGWIPGLGSQGTSPTSGGVPPRWLWPSSFPFSDEGTQALGSCHPQGPQRVTGAPRPWLLWAPSPDRDLGRGGGDGVAAAGALEAARRLRAGVGGKGQDLRSSTLLQWDPVPAPVVAPGSLRRGEESRLPRPLQQAATCACLSPERWARLASAEEQAEATAAQAKPAPPAAHPPPPAAARAAGVVGALWRPASQLQPRLGPRPQRGLSPPPVVCPPRVQAAPLLEARLLRGPGTQRLPRTYFHCIALPTRVWAIGRAGRSGDHRPRPSRGAGSLRRCVPTAEFAGLERSACTRPSAL